MRGLAIGVIVRRAMTPHDRRSCPANGSNGQGLWSGSCNAFKLFQDWCALAHMRSRLRRS